MIEATGARPTAEQLQAVAEGDLSTLIPAFERSLRASGKSPKTVQGYTETARSSRRPCGRTITRFA
jgi:hypothetical protein